MKTIFEIEAEILDLSLKAMLNPAETIQLGVLAGLVPLIYEIAKLRHEQATSNEMARAWQGAWAYVDRSVLKPDAKAGDARALINEILIFDCKKQPLTTVPGVGPILDVFVREGDVFASRSNGACPVVWVAQAGGWVMHAPDA